jgi:DNA-binding transcriptional regulator YiaG
MTGEQYQQAINHLKMTQVASSRLLGVNASTARRWISGARAVPTAVEKLLLVMIHCGLTPDHILHLNPEDILDRVAP